MGWQQDFICGGRQKVLLFILCFGKPLRTQVGGLGAQVNNFNSVIHWMFHCSEMEKCIGIQVYKNLKEKRTVAFIFVTQLTFHPLPTSMAKLFRWYHSVHLVTSTTLCICFLGVYYKLVFDFLVTSIKVVLWSPFQQRSDDNKLHAYIGFCWLLTTTERINEQHLYHWFFGHFYSCVTPEEKKKLYNH